MLRSAPVPRAASTRVTSILHIQEYMPMSEGHWCGSRRQRSLCRTEGRWSGSRDSTARADSSVAYILDMGDHTQYRDVDTSDVSSILPSAGHLCVIEHLLDLSTSITSTLQCSSSIF